MNNNEMHGNLLYAPNQITILEKGIVMRIPFENGYTASLVRHDRSYGGDLGYWEIGIMVDGELVYDTPIASDVLGWLKPAEVNQILTAIERLPIRSES